MGCIELCTLNDWVKLFDSIFRKCLIKNIEPKHITGMVISYARPWNVPVIVDSMLEFGFDKVVIADNWIGDEYLSKCYGSIQEHRKSGKVRLFRGVRNVKTLARYTAIDFPTASNVIASVDDDYVVTPSGWERLISNWDNRNIICQLPVEGSQFQTAYTPPYVNIGYGCLFNRNWPVDAFRYLLVNGVVTMDEFRRFGDRIFTTFYGLWKALPATGSELVKLTNPSGEWSERDGAAIHLKDGYWNAQWDLVMRVKRARVDAQEILKTNPHSLSEYQGLTDFLSYTAVGG